MTSTALDAQMTRISEALKRIDAAAAHAPPGVNGPALNESAHAELQHRHDRLRAETAEALAALDAVIQTMSLNAGQS